MSKTPIRMFKSVSGLICSAVLATAGLLTGGSAAFAADSNAVLIAYNPTTISQQVNVSNIAGTSRFVATANVAKNNWQNDYAYLEVQFKDSGGTVLTTKRSPASGWTTLTSAVPIDLTVTLTSNDPAWSASITAVQVIVGGDDGEYWAGNYGTAIDFVTLDQTTNSGTNQLLANPEFASGSSSWTSSAGWQTCSGGGGAAACVYSAYAPPTTSTTSTTSTTVVTTTTTSTTTTTTTIAPPASTSTTTSAPATSTTVMSANAPATVPTAVTVPATETSLASGSAADATASTTRNGAAKTPATSPISSGSSTSTTTTTTLPPPVITAANGPVDPAVLDNLADGASFGLLDGQPIKVVPRVGDRTVVVTVGTTSFQVSATDDAPESLTVDANGRILLDETMKYKFTVMGAENESPFELWLYSEPQRLVADNVNGAGSFTGTGQVPADAPRGHHNLVLATRTADGKPAVVSLSLGLPQRTNFVAEIAGSAWVWVLIALAIGAAVVLPGGGLRRRRPVS